MVTAFIKTGGWDDLAKRLDPGVFKGKLKTNIQKANRLNGHLVQRQIRADIRGGDFVRNAELTQFIKRSSKPLVDTGSGLFQAITVTEVQPNVVFVGILQSNEMFNIAMTLHEGASIAVTERMRNMFALLARVSAGDLDPSALTGRAAELWERRPTGAGGPKRDSRGKFLGAGQQAAGWKPLRPDTVAIVIPGRPFIRRAFENDALTKKIEENWAAAVQAALKKE